MTEFTVNSQFESQAQFTLFRYSCGQTSRISRQKEICQKYSKINRFLFVCFYGRVKMMQHHLSQT